MLQLNSLDDNVKFTTSFSKSSVEFLDLQLFKQPGHNRIVHRSFCKPLNLHLFIPAMSAHNPQCLTAFIYGEALRLARNCSFEEDFIAAITQLKVQLLGRGYPLFTVLRMVGKVTHSDRVQQLERRVHRVQRVTPVILPYHAQFKQLKLPKLIHTFLRDIKPHIAPLRLAWKKAPSLQTILGLHK
jgi:hypothetical protein